MKKLDHNSVEPGKRAWLLRLVAWGGGLFVMAAISLARIRFLRLIEEFDLPPPLLSKIAFHASLPLALLALVAAAVAIEFTAIGGRRGNAANLAILILALLGLAVFLVGAMSTIFAIVRALSY